jgi:integrase
MAAGVIINLLSSRTGLALCAAGVLLFLMPRVANEFVLQDCGDANLIQCRAGISRRLCLLKARFVSAPLDNARGAGKANARRRARDCTTVQLGGKGVRSTNNIEFADLRNAGEMRAWLAANGCPERIATRADGTETVVGLPQLDAACGYTANDPGCLVSALTTEWTRKFSRDRMADGAGPAMVNRSLQCLRRGLNLLHEDGKLAAVPKIRLHKEPGARTEFLAPEKFAMLLRALPSYLRPLVTALYLTGLRKGEALAIDWAQVDLQAREIRLTAEQAKAKEGRVLPIFAPLAALLEPMQPKRGPVFDGTNLRTEWEKACAATGLGTRVKVDGPAYAWHAYKGLRLHDLRRSAVRNLRVLGKVPETVAMKISGHKTRHVFDRYNIVTTDDLHAAAQAVDMAMLALLPAAPAKSKGKLSVQPGRTKQHKTTKPA